MKKTSNWITVLKPYANKLVLLQRLGFFETFYIVFVAHGRFVDTTDSNFGDMTDNEVSFGMSDSFWDTIKLKRQGGD